MSEIVVAVMACFMVLGAADKALFSGRLGYGEEFEKGLGAMGPLSMSMVGIMCAAPSIGAFLGPALTPFFTAIGSDPSVAACMVLGVDSGGLPLALALAKTHEAAMLSGLGLGGSFGCIMTFALPISLSICSEESRPDVARGLVAGIIAAPFSLFTVAAVMGYGFGDVLRLGLPAFAVAAILALLLTFCRDAAVRGCLLVGRLMMAAFVVLLASAAIEHWFSVTLIPGMAPIGRQLEIVGEIGVMLSGAFPMVKFAERHFGGRDPRARAASPDRQYGVARHDRFDRQSASDVCDAEPYDAGRPRGVFGVFRTRTLPPWRSPWVHHRGVPRRHDSDAGRENPFCGSRAHDRAPPCPRRARQTGRGKDGLSVLPNNTSLSRFNKNS